MGHVAGMATLRQARGAIRDARRRVRRATTPVAPQPQRGGGEDVQRVDGGGK